MILNRNYIITALFDWKRKLFLISYIYVYESLSLGLRKSRIYHQEETH